MMNSWMGLKLFLGIVQQQRDHCPCLIHVVYLPLESPTPSALQKCGLCCSEYNFMPQQILVLHLIHRLQNLEPCYG